MSHIGEPTRVSLIANHPGFYRWESDWIHWLLSDFQVEDVFDPTLTTLADNAVVVVSGDLVGRGDEIDRYLLELTRRNGNRPVVFHFSDEAATHPIGFYPRASAVFRSYLRGDAMRIPNCRYLPLGYSNSFGQLPPPRPLADRGNRWSFAGAIRRPRAAMLKAFRQIGPGTEHLTGQWEDPNGLGRSEYIALLSDSVLVPCPMGNVSPDTFRLYEAIEAGAVPIVEDDGGWRAWSPLLSPRALALVRPWQRQRRGPFIHRLWRRSYWHRAYGDDFPCPLICHWETLPQVLKSIELQPTADRVYRWWQARKHAFRQQVRYAVGESLRSDTTRRVA